MGGIRPVRGDSTRPAGVSVITIMKKLTQRGGKQKSGVENEFVVFRVLLASD